jgi:hypothetical protein
MTEEARGEQVRGSLAALLVYTLAALVIFYPVPFRLNSVLAGFTARDGWEHAWWLWFARRLLLEGRGLNDLYLLNHPAGLHHPYQWALASFSLIASPLASLFSPAATFNLMVLGSFVLCGLAAYHLCRALTHNHWAAIVGGAIFAFSSNRLGHALGGWLPQMTAYLYPWYALLLIRTLRHPTLRRSIGLGVLAGIAATVWPMHILYFMLPLTLVIVGADLIRRRRAFFEDRRGRYLGLAFVISLAIALPFLLPLILGQLYGELGYLSTSGIVGHSTDLLAFFTPSPYHPILAPLRLVPSFAQRVLPNQEALRASLAYPGLAAVLLALWGVLRTRPRPWSWVVLAAGAVLLSLGPLLVVGGEPVEYTVDGYQSYVLLPYAFARKLPLLNLGRTPGRLNATGMLGLAVLAAYGLTDLLSRLTASRRRAGLLALATVALVLFEYLPLWPFPAGDAAIPPVIQYIADRPGDGALLHLPMSRRRVNNRALYFQTATGRPIVGGKVLRMLPETPPWWETIEGLVIADPAPDVVPRPAEDQRRAWLRHLNVDWVLLHRLEPDDEPLYRPFIERLLGPAVVADETLIAFPVPDNVPSPKSSRLYAFSRQGWRQLEQDGALWRRWMYNDGQLYVYSTREEIGSLRFTVDSHLAFPLLEVYQGERLLDTFVVGERTTYATRPLTLTQGMNVFRFHAPGGCPEALDDPRCWSDALLAPPAGDGAPPCDARTTCRTFVFDHISFIPQKDLPAGAALDVNFGDQMRLRGWGLDAATLHPGDALTVTLTWETMVEPSEQYVVFVHLLFPDGTLAAQHDAPPAGRLVPPSAWLPGSTFSYPATLKLPDDLPAGDYYLQVGVYLWPSLERLPVLSGPEVGQTFQSATSVRIAP